MEIVTFPNPKASIIILAHNQLEYTKACIASIEEHTPGPYELVLVDNGSTDGTRAFFERKKRHGAKTVYNGHNLGYSSGVNQGLRVSQGDRIVLLNNDTLVTEGWLSRLAAPVKAKPITGGEAPVGIVGPITNRVRPGAQYFGEHYSTRRGLALWARFVARMNTGNVVPVDSVVGMCMLITRACFERVGLFDERFGIGNFEDDDYCRRARALGFEVAIATDCWIHHEGSVTFRAAGIDYNSLIARNRRLLEEKWKDPRKAAVPRQGLLVVAR